MTRSAAALIEWCRKYNIPVTLAHLWDMEQIGHPLDLIELIERKKRNRSRALYWIAFPLFSYFLFSLMKAGLFPDGTRWMDSMGGLAGAGGAAVMWLFSSPWTKEYQAAEMLQDFWTSVGDVSSTSGVPAEEVAEMSEIELTQLADLTLATMAHAIHSFDLKHQGAGREDDRDDVVENYTDARDVYEKFGLSKDDPRPHFDLARALFETA